MQKKVVRKIPFLPDDRADGMTKNIVEEKAEDFEIKMDTSQNQESNLYNIPKLQQHSAWMPSGFTLQTRNQVEHCLKCKGCVNNADKYRTAPDLEDTNIEDNLVS